MTRTVETSNREDVFVVARRAREAARVLATLSGERRNEVLISVASAIEDHAVDIIAANEQDCRAAAPLVEEGKLARSLFKRLQTSERGIAEMALRVREVARLDDPLGRTLTATELDDNLTLRKVTCPLGVIGVVFEARPDVVPQVASLCFKSGNAAILKGGAEAARTNEVLVSIWREVLASSPDVPADAVSLLQTREDVRHLLALDEEVDLIIPRGSNSFVRYVMEHSRIPVMGHGDGVCHVYVDKAADEGKALDIAFDAKVQYPAVCNAMETLLVHREIASRFLPEMIRRFQNAWVEVRGCARTIELSGAPGIVPAAEEDWSTEYSDLIVSIKVVDNRTDAVAHINHYGSHHTEAIVTEDKDAASSFMQSVDAASVFCNASTRFADGFRYGLGAEVGISNGKLHARGPVGLEGLTTYKYQLYGDGHTVASYSNGERTFKHRRVQ